MAQVEFIAHRGESADAPENTLAAFRLAWERKVDAIELDIHLTQDGEAIVCHDADTERTTGLRKVIRESALAELRQLDAGRWKGAHWAGERLPTLREALETIPQGARCFIEIKTGPEAVPAVERAIRQSGKTPAQLAIISFRAESLAEAKRRLPQIKTYYLAGFRQDPAAHAWTPDVETLIAQAQSIRADGLDLSAPGPIDSAFARRVQVAGLTLTVWTVDDPEIAQQMVAAGVDGITSNRAAWLRAELQRR
ncbi:MAG TPA: glycerophosphodiester phosphodiesterase [Chthonomonadaceae bacterium]|nr:glycerophosphodiester phosphodiesterase [Chthonomonadaceae bacterium]